MKIGCKRRIDLLTVTFLIGKGEENSVPSNLDALKHEIARDCSSSMHYLQLYKNARWCSTSELAPEVG